MKVAVIGSRACCVSLEYVMEQIPGECSLILSGGAKGIDRLAAHASALLGCELCEILPDYRRYGARAPLVRNLELVEQADTVLAFWDMKSPGTRQVIEVCLKRGVPIRLVPME